MRRNRRGFGMTLPHVVLALATVAVATGAVSTVALRGDPAEMERLARVEVNNLALALDHYQLSVGRWPSQAQGLDALLHNPGEAGWRGPYITPDERGETPRDPWGNPYLYNHDGPRGIAYEVFSAGPDGVAGTENDIGNWGRSKAR